jgi:hypothetical protein
MHCLTRVAVGELGARPVVDSEQGVTVEVFLGIPTQFDREPCSLVEREEQFRGGCCGVAWFSKSE